MLLALRVGVQWSGLVLAGIACLIALAAIIVGRLALDGLEVLTPATKPSP